MKNSEQNTQRWQDLPLNGQPLVNELHSALYLGLDDPLKSEAEIGWADKRSEWDQLTWDSWSSSEQDSIVARILGDVRRINANIRHNRDWPSIKEEYPRRDQQAVVGKKLWNWYLGGGENLDDLKKWGWTVLKHAGIDGHRAEKKHRENRVWPATNDLSSEASLMGSAECGLTEPQIERREKMQVALRIGDAVQSAVEKMDDDSKELWRLRYTEGKSLPKIADELGLTLEQAKWLWRKTLNQLKENVIVQLKDDPICSEMLEEQLKNRDTWKSWLTKIIVELMKGGLIGVGAVAVGEE